MKGVKGGVGGVVIEVEEGAVGLEVDMAAGLAKAVEKAVVLLAVAATAMTMRGMRTTH